MQAVQRAQAQAGRDIAPLPTVVDPKRKKRCRRNFRLFCETYLPASFPLQWSADHLRVLKKIQKVVLHGGLLAVAMPRGSGKTTILEAAVIWATVYGHRRYVVAIGAEAGHAKQILDSIKAELAQNELLGADFPEVVYPIIRLDGIHQRAKGQTFRGRQTLITWTEEKVVFPTLPRVRTSGTITQVAGLTGRVRGMKHKLASGESLRPDLVLVDDPQTDESARSQSQVATRMRLLNGAILGLAGPGKKIAGLAAVTVMQEDDLASQILDSERCPEWQGERTRMLDALPNRMELWREYMVIRAEGLRTDRGIADATAFYRANLKPMREGALVAWPARYEDDEIDGLQCAMNILARDEFAFWAEYQNEPLPEIPDDSELPDADQITERTNGIPLGVVPRDASKLTAFIDVQGRLLYYLVAAWREDFTGYVVAYGAEPEQTRPHFTLRNAAPTLQKITPRAGLDGSIYSGLERLADRLAGEEWKVDGGGTVRLDRVLVDANWGRSTDSVYQFCRQSTHAAILTPAHGKYVGARGLPFTEYRRRRGDRLGLNWRIPSAIGRHRAIRHALFDSNFWKDFVMDRLGQVQGDPGAMTLFGESSRRHELLADHLTAETRAKVEARGRTVNEWRIKRVGVDNHWFDCLVGAAVAASIAGLSLEAAGDNQRRTGKKRLKLSEIQAGKR